MYRDQLIVNIHIVIMYLASCFKCCLIVLHIIPICRSNRIHCTLWEGYAERMHRFLTSHDSAQPLIMILQLGKLKRFFG